MTEKKAIEITQEESIELEKALTPLILKYGKSEVLAEVSYIVNFIIK